ncbi:hypothetical protein L218DRAFT_987254 [Marasmius fiardii PR-910]|nr:hypothetical protein L218DRAFT_987254 [Marasmius fiardii PR-910]
MESKLKALKVVDLKAILTKAEQPAPAKSNKQDLISRIIASEKAISVYNAEHGSPDDLLAPPEDLDWNADEVAAAAKPAAKPDSTKSAVKSPSKAAADPPPTPAPVETPTPVDPEEEKRRKRAERFGIPIVESKTASQPLVNSDKLKARATRFGIKTDDTGKRLDTPQSSLKRASPATEQADPEEAERRKKRAARFGLQPQAEADPEEQKKREQRAARFGAKSAT